MTNRALRWFGHTHPHFDQPHIERAGPLVLGCYGGTTAAGADKNEDGALLWSGANNAWELALICDAHHSAESTAMLLDIFSGAFEEIQQLLEHPAAHALPELERLVEQLLRAPATRERCRQVRGEASCLLVVRREAYVWWWSIGDCVAYLLHPILTQFGQYGLNQRVFYQWIGHVNTFDRGVACRSSGVQLLQPGPNIILLATDGLLECGTEPFTNPQFLYALFSAPESLEQRIELALNVVKNEQGRDSATIVAWEFNPTALYERSATPQP